MRNIAGSAILDTYIARREPFENAVKLGEIHIPCIDLYRAAAGGYSAPTVKQHLAAIRRLHDWLIVGQAVNHTLRRVPFFYTALLVDLPADR